MKSDVSIIITNYNYGAYISRCLRSCLDQFNFKPQIIVVDDCSTDNSMDHIGPFIDDIMLIKNEENIGVAASANRGIKASKGQFVVRVDADDFINDNLSFFLRSYLVANHDAFCVSCDYILVDDYENVIERKYAETNPISCGIMYRRDLFLALGGYDDTMRHREEEELRYRLGDKYSVHHSRMPLYRYRMHASNKTKDPEYMTWNISTKAEMDAGHRKK